MKPQPFNWREDAIASYAVWAAAKREEAVRSGQIAPQTARERRWSCEGPRPVSQLEAGTTPATDHEGER